jgi:hypothetical protein
VGPDGACPTCGRVLSQPPVPSTTTRSGAPWHFKLLLVALVIYLAYRGYQGIVWVLG